MSEVVLFSTSIVSLHNGGSIWNTAPADNVDLVLFHLFRKDLACWLCIFNILGAPIYY